MKCEANLRIIGRNQMRSITCGVIVGLLATVGCASGSGTGSGTAGSKYAVKGVQVEGCECDSVCPCIFSKDTTHGDCRGIFVWSFREGHSGGVDLSGVVLAAVLTKSGANMEKALGQWTGIIYVSDKATPAQKNAAVDVMKAEMGQAFAKIEVKSAPIEIKSQEDRHEVSIGKVGTLKIKGIKGANGRVMVIENAPSPIAPPKLWCATSEVNSYDDGMTKWDFKGRNAFYTNIELKSK
jgi:hypothetical protein